jgi:hypothetical protein
VGEFTRFDEEILGQKWDTIWDTIGEWDTIWGTFWGFVVIYGGLQRCCKPLKIMGKPAARYF